MSTVPKADTPAPADNHITFTVSDAMSGNYGRPANGGPPVEGKQEGNPDSSGAGVPPGVIPGAGAYTPPGPAAVSTGNTQAGADIGSGATLVVGQPDATGHPLSDTSGGGTVGDSGNQNAGSGPMPSGL